MRLIKYLTYSGLNVTIKLNPCHWRLAFNKASSVEIWEVEHSYILELFPITIKFWIDDGSW